MCNPQQFSQSIGAPGMGQMPPINPMQIRARGAGNPADPAGVYGQQQGWRRGAPGQLIPPGGAMMPPVSAPPMSGSPPAQAGAEIQPTMQPVIQAMMNQRGGPVREVPGHILPPHLAPPQEMGPADVAPSKPAMQPMKPPMSDKLEDFQRPQRPPLGGMRRGAVPYKP